MASVGVRWAFYSMKTLWTAKLFLRSIYLFIRNYTLAATSRLFANFVT